MNDNTINYRLEEIIDKIGVSETLQRLVTICHEKSEHLLTSWQSSSAAVWWESMANAIDNIKEPIK